MNKLDILAQKEEELRKLNEEIEQKNKNVMREAEEAKTQKYEPPQEPEPQNEEIDE